MGKVAIEPRLYFGCRVYRVVCPPVLFVWCPGKKFRRQQKSGKIYEYGTARTLKALLRATNYFFE
jgi:hypothetical protein